jgi:hypothetical protein
LEDCAKFPKGAGILEGKDNREWRDNRICVVPREDDVKFKRSWVRKCVGSHKKAGFKEPDEKGMA